MKKVVFAVLAVGLLAGCTQTEQGAAIGGLGGAAVGAAVSGDAGGALVGGLAGATVGALIGAANEPGKCYYRGKNGRRYIANC